jgi:hypothetical protein
VPLRVQPCKSLKTYSFWGEPGRRVDEPQAPRSRNSYPGACNSFLFYVALAVALTWMGSAAPLRAATRSDQSTALQVQQVVDALRARLGIAAEVRATIVDRDPRTLSVQRDPRTPGTFALSIERGFAEGLSAGQLEAALAHELGHVWIYTHHPYLQTEQLANRVAMRAVSRERLVEVYRTLWGADALHGDLAAFLGVEATQAQ